MNIKSNVLKSVFAAGLALTGVAAISLGTNGQADAATIGDSVTVDYIDGQSIATWSNYYTATVTGSVKDGSSWKVVKTARDASGEKWYKIGKRQWIMAKYTTEATASNSTYNANTTSTNTANNTNSSTGTGYTTSYSSSANNYGYGSNYNYSYSANTGSSNTSSYSASTSASTSTASASTSGSTSSSSSEAAAKAWIASKESGGSYTASNGNYYGKYQLSLSYLNGDTSAANQEKVANSYVQSRYGSWTAAKAFWQANGWY